MRNERTEPILSLRVVTEYDAAYKVYVAYCLETGSVVTADDQATVESMIEELLSDEVEYALEHDRAFSNLTSSPAPLEIVAKWMKAAETGKVEPRMIQVKSEQLRLLLGRREVTTELRIVKVA